MNWIAKSVQFFSEYEKMERKYILIDNQNK